MKGYNQTHDQKPVCSYADPVPVLQLRPPGLQVLVQTSSQRDFLENQLFFHFLSPLQDTISSQRRRRKEAVFKRCRGKLSPVTKISEVRYLEPRSLHRHVIKVTTPDLPYLGNTLSTNSTSPIRSRLSSHQQTNPSTAPYSYISDGDGSGRRQEKMDSGSRTDTRVSATTSRDRQARKANSRLQTRCPISKYQEEQPARERLVEPDNFRSLVCTPPQFPKHPLTSLDLNGSASYVP